MLKNKKIIISFHEAIAVGPAYDLKKFLLLNNTYRILFISHPLTFKREYYRNSSKYEFYRNQKLIKKQKAFHWILPDVLLYLKDIFYTFLWSFKHWDKYDLFIGLDPLNALSGLILKKIGLVDKVIYYSIDYFPIRFSNRIMNRIYHYLDKLSVKFSNETWNLSPNMAKSREKIYSASTKKIGKQILVPIGIWSRRTNRKSFNKINKQKAVFIGLVDPASGIDLAIDSLKDIIKTFPNFKLEIIGGGPDLKDLKEKAKKSGFTKHVKFHGWITNRTRIESILADGAIGLALFNPSLIKEEVKNADPMKIKDYMVLGLPVITTSIVSTSKKIHDAKAGISIGYNTKEFTAAVIKLLKSEKDLKNYKLNAIQYVQQFDIEEIYSSNLNRILNKK